MSDTDQTLLKYRNFQLKQSAGCCGLFEIFRLRGAYESEDERAKRIEQLMLHCTQITPVTDAGKLHKLLDSMHQSSLIWSFPLEWGFAGVLSALDRPTPPNLYWMSDNMDDEGDVHTGAFSTKNFVMWLKEMDVGDIHEVPAKASHRGGGHPIQIWVYHPDWPKVREVITTAYNLAKEYHKEILNVEDKVTQVRIDRNKEYIATFSRAAGWE